MDMQNQDLELTMDHGVDDQILSLPITVKILTRFVLFRFAVNFEARKWP
jgi:hypothetical protein